VPDRITAVKKSSLAGLSEGWGEECYAIVRPARYADMIALDGLDPTDKTAAAEHQRDLVRKHFVAGKIKVWTDDGKQELLDMTVDDVECSVEVMDKLFADIIGIDVDPKDLREAVAQGLTQESNGNNTGTPSSIETSNKSATKSPAS
jgi:hypothetical protein